MTQLVALPNSDGDWEQVTCFVTPGSTALAPDHEELKPSWIAAQILLPVMWTDDWG